MLTLMITRIKSMIIIGDIYKIIKYEVSHKSQRIMHVGKASSTG